MFRNQNIKKQKRNVVLNFQSKLNTTVNRINQRQQSGKSLLEGSIIHISKPISEFLASDGDMLQNDHQSYFKTIVRGVSLLHFNAYYMNHLII